MKKSDFYYNLPQEFIAQTPVEPRDSSRMMVVDKKSGKIEHRHFYDILDYITENDCIIINDTRVLPARIYGVKKDTGAIVEFLLLSQKENDVWECVTGPGRRAKPGTEFDFNGLMTAHVVDVLDGGNRLVKFTYEGNFYNVLDEIGEMPLPHYITEKLEDKERYQTVYSENLGSAAAPTAGLHFTPALLDEIAAKGIKIGKVTLHVGLGTFRPVKEENIENHLMHSEHYYLPKETADLINRTHENGGRVFAVGTTTCRTLESVATKHGKIIEDDDWTSIFIYPGYKFKCIDSLITNFHLPESTLIMLVSAFAGYENTMNAYKIAVEEKYRFFSFGDSSMFTDLT
ncbi:MAG: tRNA preQ1(34) S-adenosylmethionine ribosyltransferase-isomerase QueA [Clostridia bacterium]|nr:tRNA preQ1(34) S-adenosylmethionine ribosyltransferase-isomerase QueA [Clostridia bacterium]